MLEKCKICGKETKILRDGVCKHCRDETDWLEFTCDECGKLTAFKVEGLCLSCLRDKYPKDLMVQYIVSNLHIYDVPKLESVSKLSRIELIEISAKLGILSELNVYTCLKCGCPISESGLCSACEELIQTLKKLTHTKNLNVSRNKKRVNFHTYIRK